MFRYFNFQFSQMAFLGKIQKKYYVKIMVFLKNALFSPDTLLTIFESESFYALEISSYRLEIICHSLGFKTLFLIKPFFFSFYTSHSKLNSKELKLNLIMFIEFQ